MEKIVYEYWVSSIPGIGSKSIEKLKEWFGDARGIYDADEKELKNCLGDGKAEKVMVGKRKTLEQIKTEYGRLKDMGIRFVCKGEEVYPERLRRIKEAPNGLFLKGTLPTRNEWTVAVIGARDCTEYGKYIAKTLGEFLGKQKISVISGMARGVDGICQNAVLDAGGCSYAILGCGVDICYPRQCMDLYEKLCVEGGVIAEYPPGTRPIMQNFPYRNRIVSGLSDAVVVIEARENSGTLLTAAWAKKQKKTIYVVPGRITDRLSDGCNRLLKNGAKVFLSPEEFVRDLYGMDRTAGKENERAGDCLETEILKIDSLSQKDLIRENSMSIKGILSNVMDFEPKNTEEILRETEAYLGKNILLRDIQIALMDLCLEGRIKQTVTGWYVKNGE